MNKMFSWVKVFCRSSAEEVVDLLGLKKPLQEQIMRDLELAKQFLATEEERKQLEMLVKKIDIDKLCGCSAQLYAENFTEEELQDICKFLKTKTGKKYSQLMPHMMRRGKELSEKYFIQLMDEVDKARKSPFRF